MYRQVAPKEQEQWQIPHALQPQPTRVYALNLIYLVTSFHIPEACQAPGLPTPPQLGSLAGASSFYHPTTPKLLPHGAEKMRHTYGPEEELLSRGAGDSGLRVPVSPASFQSFCCCSILIRPILPSSWPKNVYSPKGGL